MAYSNWGAFVYRLSETFFRGLHDMREEDYERFIDEACRDLFSAGQESK